MGLIPWGQILTIAIQIFGFALDKSKASKEVREMFRNFVDKMNDEKLTSIKFKKSWEEIKKTLENKNNLVK